jgi:hypothetical protein
VDWNEDGKKDLVLGGGTGRVHIYLNVNTDADPVFDSYLVLVAAGKPLDVGQGSAPFIVDWNNDGVRDMLVGEYLGRVYLLINTGTNKDPLFPTKPFLMDGASIMVVGGGYSGPMVQDYNRDGKKDLLAGGTNGMIHFYENKNTDEDPQFDGFELLKAGGIDIKLGQYTKPDAVDWDGDGFMDILCGCGSGHVYFFHALGPLAVSTNQISAASGDAIDFMYDGGAANGNRKYLTLGSVTGTSPGIPLPGGQATLPLNWDPFTNVVIQLINTPVFDKFMGQLDASGEAAGKLSVPPLDPATVGLVMYYAYCLNNPFDYVSNPPAIEIVP